MPIPPDTRAPGDTGHIADHNNIADELTVLTAGAAAEASRAQSAEALLAPKASPALTGTPTAPTATALTSSTQVATTAYADSAVAAETGRAAAAETLKAPLASPALTGSPTAPTQSSADSSTKIATTAYADSAVAIEKTRAVAVEAGLLPFTGGTVAGPVTLPVTDSGGQVFNVKAYGALGNGSHDDTTAWQAALSAAVSAGTSARGNGGTVLFPSGGHYMVNELDFSSAATAKVAVHVVADGAIIEHNASAGGVFVNFAGVPSTATLLDSSFTGATLYPKQSSVNPTTDLIYMTAAFRNKLDVRAFDPGLFASSSGSALHMYGRAGQGIYYSEISLRVTPGPGYASSYGGTVFTIDGQDGLGGGTYIQSNQFPVLLGHHSLGTGFNDLGSGENLYHLVDMEYNAGYGLVMSQYSTGVRFDHFYFEGNNSSGDQWSLPLSSTNGASNKFTGSLATSPSAAEVAWWGQYNDCAYLESGGSDQSFFSPIFQAGAQANGWHYPRVYGAANQALMGMKVQGDASDRVNFQLDSSGQPSLLMGTGAAAPDILLERIAAGRWGPGSTVVWQPFGGEAQRTSPISSGPHNIAHFERLLLCDAGSAGYTVNLNSSQGIPGEIHTITKIDSSVNAITVAAITGSFTIGGASTYTLSAQWQSVTVVCSASFNWVIVGTSSGAGTVTSVTAGDTSIVVGGTTSAPTIETATLDVIAADHPPAANWSNNAKKITAVANGSAAQDAATFGQIPASLPPSGSAGGVLTGTYPNPGLATVTVAEGGTGQTSSAAAYNALSPMTTTGDLEYESATGAASRLAGNTATQKMYLSQAGTGSVSAAPAWSVVSGQYLCAPSIYAPPNRVNLAVSSTTLAPFNSAPTTVAAGSNGGEISQVASWSSPSAGVLDAASTTGYPSSGTLAVATSTTTATVTYTGIAAGQFTGCAYVSGSATGIVATGGAVTLTSVTLQTGSFTAPSSGSVLVTLHCALDVGTTADSVMLALEQSGTIYGYTATYALSGSGVPGVVTVLFYVTGLTSGNGYQFQLYGAATSAISAVIFTQGLTGTSIGNNGAPIVMTVQAV